MKTLQTLCLLCAVVALAGGSAFGITILQDDFEGYTQGSALNTSGIWDSVTVGNSNGSYSWGRQLSIRPGSSPFGPGGQNILEFWDNATNRYLNATANITPTYDYPMIVSWDQMLGDGVAAGDPNAVIGSFSSEGRLVVADSGGNPASAYFIATDSGTTTRAVGYTDNSNSLTPVQTLDVGVWYHMELTLPVPSGSINQPATLSIQKWDGGIVDLGTFAITSRMGLNDIDRFILGDNGPHAKRHWYVDNFQVEVMPEPASMGVLGLVAGVGALFRRMRRR